MDRLLQLTVALVLVSSGCGLPQNPFKGFDFGGFLKFAARETSKAVSRETQGKVQLINPVNAFTDALGNSDQSLSVGTPFGQFTIGGGGGGQRPSPAPATTLPTPAPTPAPTTRPPTAAPCRGGRCGPGPDQQQQTGGGAQAREELFPGCGVNRNLGTRIVGGTVADPAAWPWMAALLRDTPGFFCGGALISPRHVLTAAHCVARFRPREVRVRLGVYDFSNDTAGAGVPVRRIAVHPRYDTTLYRYDAAVLTLERPAALGDAVWPICLPPGGGGSYTNQRATVIGWGTIYSGGPVSSVLRQLTIPVWSQRECDAAYPQTIDRVFVCAGGRRGGQDACQGDSGGPLQHQRADKTWSVIGVVSWGKKCAEPGYPGVYTRVTQVLSWIRRQTG